MKGSLKPEDVLRAARELPLEELPELIGQLEAAKATAWARLTLPSNGAQDQLLDVDTAAARLGVSQDYLYHHHRQYPFTRREGRKLLFSSLGIEKHISQHED